jgi:CheY-like chemotaxis protein
VSRILVIDDDDGFRKMVCAFLEAEGHEVIEAVNGQDGLDKFRSFDPELIVTDIYMPVLNGIETIQKIRAEKPDIPVIAVSGGSSIQTATILQVAGEAGADRIMEKPFRKSAFVDTVEQLLPPIKNPEE